MKRAIAVVVVLAGLLTAQPAPAAFPGANGKIAFAGLFEPETFYPRIWTVDPDGANEAPLTYGEYPSWSADGRRLALSYRGFVITTHADGGDRALLLVGAVPSWSPGGTRLAFTRSAHFGFEPQNADIFTVGADGTGVVNLIGDPPGSSTPSENEPVWSPDGSRIAFTSSRGSGPGIHTIGADGEARKTLTSGHRDFFPDWSPDGRHIVFQRYVVAGGAWDDSDIYVMNSDGSNVRPVIASPKNDQDPVWSPDGTKIAFSREGYPDQPWHQVIVADADGTDERVVSQWGRHPDWQPLDRPPDCSGVHATPSTIAKHNHMFVTVALAPATDPDGDQTTVTITGVTQDERVGRRPDAKTGGAPGEVLLRAERRGKGDGRVYRIAFTASDGEGGECSGTAAVEVRRKRNRPAVDSAPPSYDSFTPTRP
jgi:TolB protein